jgi:hypothetical protein
MRVFWEKVGALGPVGRLVGQGFSDRDVAKKLNLTELSVRACIAWILPTTMRVWHGVQTLGRPDSFRLGSLRISLLGEFL